MCYYNIIIIGYHGLVCEKTEKPYPRERKIMNNRPFFLTDYWNRMAAEHKPLLSYKNNDLPFGEWKKEALPKLLELLGEFPEKAPLDPVIEYSVDQGDYIRQRVVFNTEAGMACPAFVLIPKSAERGHRTPAIVCSHGHGPFGKAPVAGVRSEAAYDAEIAKMNYNYAEQMAKAGFITIAPDLRGFGERREELELYGRDLCNINFLKGALFGIYPLTLNIHDIKCCIDYLETMPEVDADRIGMMGLSYGGTMTTFATAVEPRIKAADIIGYVNSFAAFAVGNSNFCGSQMVPNLYKYFDTYDIAGMIAPRPLLIEMGIYDNCFKFEDLYAGFEEVKKIYAAAGAEDRLFSDMHPHGHAFSGAKAFDFFRENL